MANSKKKSNKDFKSSKGNRNYKGKRDYKRKDDYAEDGNRGESTIKGSNDISWYVTDPSTLRAVANFPFGNPAGFDVNWVDTVDPDGSTLSFSRAVPGVMAVHFEPTVGRAQKSTDPINMAAQSIYTFIRSANSGAKNYEPVDLMVYLVAMDNLYLAYTLMMRAYSTLFSFNVMNRYMPEALFVSQGFNYLDFQGKTADFKAYIDQVALRLSKMALPAHMPYFTRHQYLGLNTFTDSTVAKAQFINYVPGHLYMYDGYSDRKGGRLIPVSWGSRETPFTLETLKETVNEMIDRVVTDIDCGIISGDVLKAFSSTGLMRCPIMPADFHLTPSYDALQLLQMHNAMALGDWNILIEQSDPDDPNEARVMTCEAFLDFGPGDNTIAPKSWIVDMPLDQVTPELVVEATRFVHNVEVNTDEGLLYAADFGSELISKFRVYYYKNMELRWTDLYSYLQYSTDSVMDMSFLSQINTHPPVHIIANSSELGTVEVGRFGQIDNYTPFQLSKMNAINNMALTAEFAVQEVNKSLYNSK